MIIDNEEIFFVDFEKDNSKSLIYAPLRSYLALIKKEMIDSLLCEKMNEDKAFIFNKLKNKNLIDINQHVECIHNLIPELTIALTDNCNLRCIYCHASAGDAHRLTNMNKDIAETIIFSYFEKIPLNTKNASIQFTGGGEPTYNFKLLKFCVDAARKNGQKRGVNKIIFSLATNGVYNDNIRRFFSKKTLTIFHFLLMVLISYKMYIDH